MSFQKPDHYATLGLDRDCSAEDIRAAYRWLAKKYHPDVNA
ncbi:MAG TPA: DnaJ domain-containing protein, partial [Verrucomicrobiae bacterium]|nr:DnaJ domain-containing protein [Verrucomicrobiae bacterium]